MFSEKEVAKQESVIKKKLLIAIIPTVLIVLFIILYQSNSLSYTKEKYFKSRNIEIKGIVIYKFEEGDFPRANRFLTLDTNFETYLNKEDYYKINLGDSVVKRKGTDSIIFKLKNGKKIIKDFNFYLRRNYNNLLEGKD
ncbi:hypothetical protein [uncultured Polaribacter sp.]|uniref:hypothetical protein n=1 Tax=uncultured Polaribacter sp. TaxID=174711 RepID=UPI00260EA4CD|nr:hypothetical protein [uncultured Polaribacter sp.]